ncbi:MAG: diaminopimelate epimerase [Janthinobacterium lividum]
MRFTKMQGVGNDFVVIDAAELPPNAVLPKLAVQTCDRNFGIGADGLLVVSREVGTETAFRMRMFNPDGSEDMCGNGLRCVSLWANRAGWLDGQTYFTVAALDGARNVELLSVSDSGREANFGVDMGIPLFEPALLPFCDSRKERIVEYPLEVSGEIFPITIVNTGSTHTVIFGPPPTEELFQYASPLIENDPLFPERTSVLWATPQSSGTFDVRIWERGAGETLGCGTGACAVGVAAVVNNLSAPNVPLDIVSKGGTLRITWPGEGASVNMVGPAQIVYDGDFASDFPA